jgi:hypothetical protein
MKERFRPGTKVCIASDSATSSYSGIFEDDGETGYFYAYDRGKSDKPILDAVYIYNVTNIVERDRGIDSEAEVFWSTDGLKAGLLINGYLHAVIDFEHQKAYCRTNFPPPGGAWTAPTREPWNDALAKLLD